MILPKNIFEIFKKLFKFVKIFQKISEDPELAF